MLRQKVGPYQTAIRIARSILWNISNLEPWHQDSISSTAIQKQNNWNSKSFTTLTPFDNIHVTLQFPTIKKKRQEGTFLGRGEERDRERLHIWVEQKLFQINWKEERDIEICVNKLRWASVKFYTIKVMHKLDNITTLRSYKNHSTFQIKVFSFD